MKYGFITAAMSAAFAIVAVNPTGAVDSATRSPTEVFRAALDAYNAGDCGKATAPAVGRYAFTCSAIGDAAYLDGLFAS